jgi:hypothetical protein
MRYLDVFVRELLPPADKKPIRDTHPKSTAARDTRLRAPEGQRSRRRRVRRRLLVARETLQRRRGGGRRGAIALQARLGRAHRASKVKVEERRVRRHDALERARRVIRDLDRVERRALAAAAAAALDVAPLLLFTPVRRLVAVALAVRHDGGDFVADARVAAGAEAARDQRAADPGRKDRREMELRKIDVSPP